jgi:hypothetical protein
MSEIDRRIALVKAGQRDDWRPTLDKWFAWYPVRLGPLGEGKLAWLRTVVRDKCLGVTNYLDLDLDAWRKDVDDSTERLRSMDDSNERLRSKRGEQTKETSFSENLSAMFDRESARQSRNDDIDAKARRICAAILQEEPGTKSLSVAARVFELIMASAYAGSPLELATSSFDTTISGIRETFRRLIFFSGEKA